MNIFYRLKKLPLSNNEQSIADLILSDPKFCIDSSAKEICEKCYVSKSTLYRLLQKLDLEGFSEFKVQLIRDLDTYRNDTGSFDADYPVKEGDSSWNTLNSLKTDYELTISTTLKLFDTDTLRKAALLLDQASVIDVYTSAGNICFADNFRFQMQEIGRTVTVPSEEYLQRLTASASAPGHAAVVISFGGRGILVQSICRKLKQTGTPIILISSEQAASLHPYGDLCLYLASIEDHTDKMSSFSTRMSLLYILDALYAEVFSLHYKENRQKKTMYYKRLTEK